MIDESKIYQCPKCLRQFDSAGGFLRFAPVVPTVQDCGASDCGAVEAFNKARDRQKASERIARRQKNSCKEATRQPYHRSASVRMPYADDDREMPEVSTASTPVRRDVSARDFETSANHVLLEFFRDPKNFNVPFRSTYLEELTARAGHPSTRMNNRAIWLRGQFSAAGWYLDNDPNGVAWGLPRGSYYKLCSIEDATSLTDEEKLRLIHSPTV